MTVSVTVNWNLFELRWSTRPSATEYQLYHPDITRVYPVARFSVSALMSTASDLTHLRGSKLERNWVLMIRNRRGEQRCVLVNGESWIGRKGHGWVRKA